jgi:hypothetical protein
MFQNHDATFKPSTTQNIAVAMHLSHDKTVTTKNKRYVKHTI